MQTSTKYTYTSRTIRKDYSGTRTHLSRAQAECLGRTWACRREDRGESSRYFQVGPREDRGAFCRQKMKNKSVVSNRQKQPSQNILRTSTLHRTLFPKAKKKSVFLKITCNGNAPFIPYIRQVTTEEERKNLTLQRKQRDATRILNPNRSLDCYALMTDWG